jgi:hypothetical protein
MLARPSIRRCQRRFALVASPRPSAAEGDAVQQRLPGRGEAGQRCPATRLHHLVAARHQPPRRLDREQVAGARLQPGPAGVAERGGEAGAVGDPQVALAVEALQLAQCQLRFAGLADDAQPAALATADGTVQPGLGREPAEEGLPAGGAGGVLGPGTGLERHHGGALCVAHAR